MRDSIPKVYGRLTASVAASSVVAWSGLQLLWLLDGEGVPWGGAGVDLR